MKYKIIICDDSKDERFNFYYRQFDNFDIYGVNRINNKFVEHDPIDSIEKLYLLIRELRSKNNLPDLILLDIFYKRKIKNANELENKFIKDIKQFKNKFYTLRNEVNRYLIPSGIDLLKKIRKDDLISSFELPISSYTDKNFNFLLDNDFNTLYELNPESLYKYRGEEDKISSTSEYFKIIDIIEKNKNRQTKHNKIFITHGSSKDWVKVQKFLEQDLKMETIELAQQVNQGNTIIQKLALASETCNYAVIVMTGDDKDGNGNLRSRENVMHEIGFFQGKYGFNKVCILHEDKTSIPANLSGIVYLQYEKGKISNTFIALKKELLYGHN